jgi:RNA polymerase sigma-70 factor (ECF subfamily)
VESAAEADRARSSADEALVGLAAAGSATAFESLLATRLDRCHRLAYSILGNEADASDATQEAVVSAWRQLPRLRDHGSFDGWLNRIVGNAARMSRRHRVRLREIRVEPTSNREGGATPSDHPDPAAGRQMDAIAAADAIGRAFDRLRDQERVILVLHYVEERPLAEIAHSLRIAVGTVKWRLHQARNALERAMEAEA